jgi:hypothetical protein
MVVLVFEGHLPFAREKGKKNCVYKCGFADSGKV